VPDDIDSLKLQLRQDYDSPGLLQVESAVVKPGPRAWKTAALLVFGDKGTGVVSRRELRVQTWERDGSGYGFAQKADFRWYCEGVEIDHVRALLNTHLPEAGAYTLLIKDSTAAVVARLMSGEAAAAADAVAHLLGVPAVRDALADSGGASAGVALVTAQRQRRVLERLRAAVLDPDRTETDLDRLLRGQWWLFGGRYLGEERKRRLTLQDVPDFLLIRPDGSLHIVEIKGANIPRLVVAHRQHHVIGNEVHLAVGQAMNYLRSFDEQVANIRHELGVDVRRASATVVVGHPSHCAMDEAVIAQTLRTYNSHLARIEVVTYAELLDGAWAALNIGEDDASSAAGELAPAVTAPALSEPDPAGEEWHDQAARDPWSDGPPSPWDDDPPF